MHYYRARSVWRDAALDFLGCRTQGLRLGIHEHRTPAGMNHGGHRGVVGVGRNEHVAAFDAQSAEDDLKRRSAAIHGYGVLCAGILSEAALEFLAIGPEGQASAG